MISYRFLREIEGKANKTSVTLYFSISDWILLYGFLQSCESLTLRIFCAHYPTAFQGGKTRKYPQSTAPLQKQFGSNLLESTQEL